MHAFAAIVLLALTAALPPLTGQQKAYLDAVKDNVAEMDEGFYSLLENASLWPVTEVPQGMVLKAETLLASPAEYRGTPVLIEGEYMGLHEVHEVKRSGPWDGKLEQWGIKVEGTDRAVMVYLSDPPPVPVKGTKVKLAARFYKVWPVQGEDGVTRPFLVFVGRSARVTYGDTLPPLTSLQQQQVRGIVDFTNSIDVGELYALLANVALWKDEPMPLSPLITHVGPLIGAPQDYRGDLFRVEGIFAGRKEVKLERPGAWPSNIEQWAVRITALNDPRDEVVVVYLLHPPKTIERGDKVRIVGRFYKVWRDYRSNGEDNIPLNFVALIGDRAEPIDALPASATGAVTGSGEGMPPSAIKVGLGLLLLLGFGMWMMRRFLKRVATGPARSGISQRIERVREERAAHAASGDNGDATDTGPPLPEDPIAALEELERRQKLES
ncbi:MAG: hypothetical protein WD768_21630 [Phycisphaeraceae bacterium]